MVTNYDIQALIDNEMDWNERIRVYQSIMNDVVAYNTYKRLKNQKRLIQKWYDSKKSPTCH